jgi:phage gpG-like protein
VKLSVTVDGLERSTRAFKVLDDSIKDFREVWPEIRMYWVRANVEHFESEGARGGQKWQPLSANYAKWKAKKYPGKPILVRTGRLFRSLTLGGFGTDIINDEQPRSLTLGTAVPYAKYHQRGTSRLAQRPVFAPTQRDIDRMVSRIYRFVERGARDAGFATRGRSRTTPGAA